MSRFIDTIHRLHLYILRTICIQSVHITYSLHHDRVISIQYFTRHGLFQVFPSRTSPGLFQIKECRQMPAASADVHVHVVSMTTSAAVCDPSANADPRRACGAIRPQSSQIPHSVADGRVCASRLEPFQGPKKEFEPTAASHSGVQPAPAKCWSDC
jgi:hypothetical protein